MTDQLDNYTLRHFLQPVSLLSGMMSPVRGPQWALSAIWYNSPDLTQTWRMSVWFSQQPHSCQSGLMINRGRFSIGSDKIQSELNMVITGSWAQDNLVTRERERGHWLFAWARINRGLGLALMNFTIYSRTMFCVCRAFIKYFNKDCQIWIHQPVIPKRLSGTELRDEIWDWFLSLLSNLLKITRISLTQCHL